jgi:hypothetical protein
MAYSGAAERSSNDRDGASWQFGSTESSRARNSSSDCNVTDIVDDYAMRRHLLHRSILCADLRSVRTGVSTVAAFGVHFYCGSAR